MRRSRRHDSDEEDSHPVPMQQSQPIMNTGGFKIQTSQPMLTPAQLEDRPKKKIQFLSEKSAIGGAKSEKLKPPPDFIVPVSQGATVKERLPYFVGNTAVLGPSGSGKSVFIANILNNVTTSEVHLFIPTSDFDDDFSYEAILKKRKIPFYMHSDDEFPDVLQALQQMKPSKKGKPLLIFDDPGNSLKNPMFVDFIKYARKITSGVILSVQSYNQILPEVWKQMRRICLSTNLSETEVSTVLERLSLSIPKEDIEQMLRDHKTEKYQFITIDLIRDEVYVRFG